MMRGVTHGWFRSSKAGARTDCGSLLLVVPVRFYKFCSCCRGVDSVPFNSPSTRGEWVAIQQYLQEEPSVPANTGVNAGALMLLRNFSSASS